VYGSPRSLISYLAGYVTKDKGITQIEYDEFGWSGRWWGVIGRSNLSDVQDLPLELVLVGRAAAAVKREFRSWLKSKGRRGWYYARFLCHDDVNHGFSVYGMGGDFAARLIHSVVALY
jgi:hypothetical protein